MFSSRGVVYDSVRGLCFVLPAGLATVVLAPFALRFLHFYASQIVVVWVWRSLLLNVSRFSFFFVT